LLLIDEHFEIRGKITECKPDLSRDFQTGVRDPWGAARVKQVRKMLPIIYFCM